MTLSVTVEGGAISAIVVESFERHAMIGGEAYKQLIEQVVSEQSLGIDGIAGATVSSNGLPHSDERSS